VAVNGGTFVLGAGDMAASSPEQRDITVGDFVLDATEVTIARFRRFVAAMNAAAASASGVPSFTVPYPDGRTTLRVTDLAAHAPWADGSRMCSWNMAAGGPRDAHPIDCVDWTTALAFCAWDGGRLPTEAEFEYVARWWRASAGAPRRFPWGDDAPTGRCDLAQWNAATCAGADGLRTRHVADLVAGQVGGLFDLAGNLHEWLADVYLPYASTTAPNECWGLAAQRDPVCVAAGISQRASRGGGWDTNPSTVAQLVATARRGGHLAQRDPARGFRCARRP
jgi:formylglycine-generating enzyme required for sulfatase activity